MTDDEEDPFADFEKPDDEDDPFADLEPDSEDDARTDEAGGDASSADASGGTDTPFDEETRPGHMPDDPFSNRDGAGQERPTGDRETASPDTADSDGGASETTGSGGDEPSIPDQGDGEDPFADLGGGPQPRTRAEADDEDDPFAAFEAVDVDEVDPDEVWANLSSLEEAEDHFDGKVYYEVSKHRFCEQCQYFSGPPETECTFDGADIVEFIDMETVRLVNCPVVAEQEELGEDVTRYEAE